MNTSFQSNFASNYDSQSFLCENDHIFSFSDKRNTPLINGSPFMFDRALNTPLYDLLR